MRIGYWFLRYYRRYHGGMSVFKLGLIALVLGFVFFFGRIAMMDFFVDRVKTEVSKLQTMNRHYVHDIPENSSSEVVFPFRIPKSCFFSDIHSCVCYDQHTIMIKDFPVDRCQDIVNGFARF
jgi:hypothetical protein